MPCITSPETDEILVQFHDLKRWPDEVRRGFEAALEITPTQDAAVVVTMRDDGISILQWVAHYRALGFNGIFVYSNDNADQSDEMLRLLAEAGVLTFIDNRTTGLMSPQRKAFEHSIRLMPALRDFEWVFYADSDEFLDLPKHDQNIGNVIRDLRSLYPTRLPSAICYRWKWFLSGHAFARTKGLLLTRFQHGVPYRPFKSLVRLQDVESMCRLHFPDLREPNFFVDSVLEPIDESRIVDQTWNYMNAPIRNEGGYVRHYWAKSFEEFAVKKRRGDALSMADNPYHRDFSLFFDWNGAETLEGRDAPPEALVLRVQQEIALLMSISGVAEVDCRLQADFACLARDAGGSRGLKAIYEEHLARRANEGP